MICCPDVIERPCQVGGASALISEIFAQTYCNPLRAVGCLLGTSLSIPPINSKFSDVQLHRAYLTDASELVAESGRRTLKSAERSVCVIQLCNNTFDDRSFAVAGLRAWNDLPATLRNTELTMGTFCKNLKTVLFTDS